MKRHPVLTVAAAAGFAFLSACAPSPAPTPAPEPVAEAAGPAAPVAVEVGDFDLTVDNIMRGELLVGTSPSQIRWSEDSRHVYFRWRNPESPDTTTFTYRVAVDDPEPVRLEDTVAARTAPSPVGAWTPDRRRRAFVRDGDVFVADVDGREWQITDTPTRHQDPHLSPDGRTVYFRTGSDVFSTPVAGGPLRQLTDIRTEDAPREEEAEGHRRFLEEQERELLQAVRDRIEEREHREAQDTLRRRVHPTYLGDRTNVSRAEVSPSGRYILLGVGERGRAEQTMVPNFVTETGYTEPIDARPKVGDVQVGTRAGIVDTQTGEVSWIEPDVTDADRTFTVVGWAPHEDRALVTALSMEYKDRWIHTVTPDGEAVTVDHWHDEAWIGGPAFTTVGWLPDGREVYFVSEESGYSHLYRVPATGGAARQLTGGAWEVTDVQLAPDAGSFWLTTSEEHSGKRALYRMPLEGGERQRVTALDGWTTGVVSPDEGWLALLHSSRDRPPELYLMTAEAGASPRRITHSTTAEFRAGPWTRPQVFTFAARDGAPVQARIYRPEEVGAERNGAAVIFVHGAGYLQNAHYGWSTYYREYMFHHLLASLGYVVLDPDYRGSAGYGRDWRTGIYRHMGGLDLTDHTDAARWLVAEEGVDPARVGIYGGSYGGFITLMAMFTKPDVFAAGAALRSVTDWAHYNHWYTSRILNQPQDDPEAYRRSSPIYFAEGLEGHLLITHGMVDTNVQFQDVVRLAQRLIELRKENWEMAVYPVEDHAFVRPDSWADQYRRILKLFEDSIGEM